MLAESPFGQGAWWPVEGDLPVTTGFVTTVGPWGSLRLFAVRPTGGSLRIVLFRSSAARGFGTYRDAEPPDGFTRDAFQHDERADILAV